MVKTISCPCTIKGTLAMRLQGKGIFSRVFCVCALQPEKKMKMSSLSSNDNRCQIKPKSKPHGEAEFFDSHEYSLFGSIGSKCENLDCHLPGQMSFSLFLCVTSQKTRTS